MASTTVTMSQAQTVTANFAVGAPSADLQVTVSDGKSAAVAGVQNTYTIVVTNAGPSYVTGAVVKDTAWQRDRRFNSKASKRALLSRP